MSTFFKNPVNHTCIDLMLTNRTKTFQNTLVIETGLSEFHKITVSLKKHILKKNPLRL